MTDQLLMVDPRTIIVDERVREGYPNLEPLIQSLRDDGMVQPLLVTKDLHLVTGGRRLEASKKANLAEVPVVVKETLTELELKKYELLENMFREDLTPYEECKAKSEIDRIQKAIHGDQAETHSRTGWSLRKTAEMLRTSPSALHQDLVLADAMEKFPELRKCKTKAEAKKQFDRLVDDLVLTEMAKKKSAGRDVPRHYRYAADHFKVCDALEGLRSLPASTLASIAEVDPPYAVDIAKVRKGTAEKAETYQEIEESDYVRFIESVATELHRVLAPDAWVVWWFGSKWYPEVRSVLWNAGFDLDEIPCIWDKLNTASQCTSPEVQLARSYEPFILARKGRPIMVKRGHDNVFRHKGITSSEKIHFTEKPVELYREILDVLAAPGSILVSPFLGSGAVLRAAYSKGMTGWGYDLSEVHKARFLDKVEDDIEHGQYPKEWQG